MTYLLSLYQRKCLIEYLMAKNSGPFQNRLYTQTIANFESAVESYQKQKQQVTGSDVPQYQKIADQIVQEFVQTHCLYNDRDYLQITINLVNDGKKIVIVPGQMWLMLRDGEAKHDFFEYHKMSDEILEQLASPYKVPDIDVGLNLAERNKIYQYLIERWYVREQKEAFSELDDKLQAMLHKFQFEAQSPDAIHHVRKRTESIFGEWLQKRPWLRVQSHGFSCRSVVGINQIVIWYSPDFELLSQGRHPLNFVRIEPSKWTDAMLRSCYHQEHVKEIKRNVQRP